VQLVKIAYNLVNTVHRANIPPNSKSRIGTQNSVDTFVLSPSNRVVASHRRQSQEVLEFNVTETGVYSIVISNTKVSSTNLNHTLI